MVGKPVSEGTRSKKFSNLVNEKIKSPKKVGSTSTASGGAMEGTNKRSRKTDESDIAVVPSSSPEPYSDDDVQFICEVEIEKIGEESQKGKRNEEKNMATKKGVGKSKAIEIIEPEVKLDKKKKKINDVSRQGEGKKEGRKKPKKVEEEDVVLLGEQDASGEIREQSQGKKEDKKFKGKEVVGKSPEKSKKGSGVRKLPEGKNDEKKKRIDGDRTGKRRNEGEPPEGKTGGKKKKVEGEKERTDKRRNEGALPESKNGDKKKKVKREKERAGKRRNEVEPPEGKNNDKKKVEGEKERTKRRNEGEKEDEKGKKKNKRQKTEVDEAKKQMNETNNQWNDGAKKEKKQEDKKKKKKVEEVEEKEDKKVKRKKNKKEKIEMDENEKNNNVLYKFPMAQVSRIIRSEDLNTKIAQEAVFVVNKAVEKFLELFCREAYACAFLDHKNYVAYNHLSSVVSKRRRFDFLSDFVPEKVKAEDALAEMSKAETETET